MNPELTHKKPLTKIWPKKLDADITELLARGKLHGFSSGGGVRVIRLEEPGDLGKLIGYGEGCHAREAFENMVKDATSTKIKNFYFTGSPDVEDWMDEWLRMGRSFDAQLVKGNVIVTLNGWDYDEISEEIKDRAYRLKGIPVLNTSDRGFTFETVWRDQLFANGEGGWSRRVVDCPPGKSEHLATMWSVKQLGGAPTFFAACEAAREAPKREVLGEP